MEEDIESPQFVVKIFKTFLFPLFLMTYLSACTVGSSQESPAPTRSIQETSNKKQLVSDKTDATPETSEQKALHAKFMGIELDYTEDFFGVLQHTTVLPVEPAEQDEAMPERIEFQFLQERGDHSSKLYIFPAAQYGAISDKAKSHIINLRSILAGRSLPLDHPLPFLPMLNAVETARSQPNFISFENGNGIYYFVLVDHDHNIMTDEILFFTFQGLTNDDQFYVSLCMLLDQISIPRNTVEDEGSHSTIGNQIVLQALEEHLHLPSLLELIESLIVSPEDGFPTPTLPSFASFPGVIAAFDPAIIGDVVHETLPVIVNAPDGSAVFLPNLPDMIRLTFEPIDEAYGSSELTIQPLRNDQGGFYPSIPAWQQTMAVDLETSSDTAGQVLFSRELTFQKGFGNRRLILPLEEANYHEPQESAYQFDGITSDGRYLVNFRHKLNLTGSLYEEYTTPDSQISADLEEIFFNLDQVVQSLAVSFDASTGSSIPENSPDCINDAEFLNDISIPDNSKIERGTTFQKTWVVRNNGTCIWKPDYQIIQAGGNPLTWHISGLPGIVLPGEEANFSVTIHSPFTPGKYHAWWQLADTNGTPFGSLFSLLFEAPEPPTDIPGYGVIEGNIIYPAGETPSLVIYFLRTDESERYALQTEEGWTQYLNEIPVGEYYVFARVSGDESDSGGGFTQAVKCGFTCEDHSLQEVVIEEGKATKDVNIQDWYAPAGTFPLPAQSKN